MRALLIAAALSEECTVDEFWDLYRSADRPLQGLRVHDPFAGGGCTLVEAARLGASVVGTDVDPLAVQIVLHELEPASETAVRAAGEDLIAHVTTLAEDLYPRKGTSTPLHYFWLHEVVCPGCHTPGLLYKNLILARDSGRVGGVVREHALTVFCPVDRTVHELDSADRRELRCCGRRLRLHDGSFQAGKYTCPSCGQRSTHRELQTGVAPRRLIAVEDTVPAGRRRLRAPTKADFAAVRKAENWAATAEGLDVPAGRLSSPRRDPRPLSYGIEKVSQLFTDRQQIVFGASLRWLRQQTLDQAVRRALTLAISNALATNNRLCSYATDYGRLSALFSVRGYPLPALPVELNPIHPSGGRGTLQNCITRVARSATTDVRRYVWCATTSHPVSTRIALDTRGAPKVIVEGSAEAELPGLTENNDLCIFDPPYFDYIAYNELSEFYRSWLPASDLVGTPLLPTASDTATQFGKRFAACLTQALNRLRPGRPLIFTYHSSNPTAWEAMGVALDEAGLLVTALWPIRSDGHMGHHSHPGNCEWDLVVVTRRQHEVERVPIALPVGEWVRRAEPLTVSDIDHTSMSLAAAMAVARFGVVRCVGGQEDGREC